MTRREVFQKAATMAVTASVVAHGKASQPATRLGFKVPPGACDCHTHIFGNPSRFPWFEGRKYTPQPALPAEMKKLHQALHVERVVIVQPSVYGTDNAATLWGMQQMGGLKRVRGIAVVDAAKVSERELLEMDRAGVRGVRINNPVISRENFRATIDRVKAIRGWHLQLFTTLATIRDLAPLILDAPVPVVVDHMAGALPELGPSQPGFADLVNLVRAGKAYVKVTHNYLSTSKSPMFEDAEVLAKMLLRANPDRILWGTDWPHPNSSSGRKATEITPLGQIDDGKFFNHSASWLELNLKRVLVENPATLYGF
jgi:predicted TIM-barrel fold metal-dependent hydrolase